jgi:hypothetical protein
MYTNDNDNKNNILMANRVEQIYDFILGVGFVVMSILALANLFIVTINEFVNYYSRQIDRIVMDESDSECSEDDDDDDDSTESEYSEYSDSETSEESERNDYDDIELSPYIPPRRSQRLAENRARCNSPLLVVRLNFE